MSERRVRMSERHVRMSEQYFRAELRTMEKAAGGRRGQRVSLETVNFTIFFFGQDHQTINKLLTWIASCNSTSADINLDGSSGNLILSS